MSTAARLPEGNDYLPVPLRTIPVGRVLPVDLYLSPDQDTGPSLLEQREVELPTKKQRRLLESGVETVYIPRQQADNYQDHLQAHLDDLLLDDEKPIQDRFQSLSEACRQMLGDVFRSGSVERIVNAAEEVSRQVVHAFSENELVVADLLRVLKHDYHTSTHSYNVASYCLLLAKELGVSDTAELEAIALGGLLHDLGKLRIPRAMLNKTTRLTNEEWDVFKRHPLDGFDELAPRGELSYAQLMMVYQHHEKLDGSGYPVGVSGDEIHPYARLCSVVDIFEALTSHRPYRRYPMSISEVLAFLEPLAGAKLDSEMVRCWTSLVGSP